MNAALKKMSIGAKTFSLSLLSLSLSLSLSPSLSLRLFSFYSLSLFGCLPSTHLRLLHVTFVNELFTPDAFEIYLKHMTMISSFVFYLGSSPQVLPDEEGM